MSSALANTPWANWTHDPIAGDASARSYTRLVGSNGQTAILMDTPKSEAASQTAFVAIAKILTDTGLAAPEILHQAGSVIVLSDLGSTDMARALDVSPQSADLLYQVASDVLLHLHRMPTPQLTKMTPDVAGEMVRITAEQYCNDIPVANHLVDEMTVTMERLAPDPTTLALRDFHAENLIWRPDQSGIQRLGLLDFQDAFIAPAGYDLASLLRDARRDVSHDIYDAVVTDFCVSAELDKTEFRAQLACLGVQRNLRILGVFARLARNYGKTRYISMLPRVWRHIQSDLAHPALASLATVINGQIPPPERAVALWKLP